uniref:Uncharacterized protein n=1 Tax=Oryza glaberrima TaxID=4538 RepID=I1NLD7_ORYGL
EMLQDGIPFERDDTSKGFDFSSSQFTVQAAATAQMKVAWEVSGKEIPYYSIIYVLSKAYQNFTLFNDDIVNEPLQGIRTVIAPQEP